MAYRTDAIWTTLSDLQGHPSTARLFKCDFFVQLCCAATDISTDIKCVVQSVWDNSASCHFGQSIIRIRTAHVHICKAKFIYEDSCKSSLRLSLITFPHLMPCRFSCLRCLLSFFVVF